MTDNDKTPPVSPLADCEAEIQALLARHRCSIVPILVVKQVGRGLPTEALISTDWRLVAQE